VIYCSPSSVPLTPSLFLLLPLPSLQPTQQQLSKKEIEDLLRKGAYGALMDDEDEGAKFCEEDIDQILQRRTKTITIESEGRGSTFAKVPVTERAPHSGHCLNVAILFLSA
jgi:hypothetical protein